MTGALIIFVFLAVIVIIVIAKTAVMVPQQNAYVVERLRKYSAPLDAGFHVLFLSVDAIRYKHSLKETAVDIPEQVCIIRDNVQVHVDGVLYFKVLAQTTLQSEIGKIDLDRTFEERTHINFQVVNTNSTKRPSRGGSKSYGTRLKTSRLRRMSWRRWKSRCGPSGKNERRF